MRAPTRPRRIGIGRSGLLGGVAVLALLLAGCGDGSSGDASEKGGSDSSGGKPTPSPTPELISGHYKPQPGQSDKVQSTLESADFECSKHSDERLDLRLCSRGVKVPADGMSGTSVTEAHVRFAADLEGTVVLAAMNNPGMSMDEEDKALRKEILGAILSPEDATIVEAGGETPSWGRYVEGSDDSFLIASDFDARKVQPLGDPFTTVTKEQALGKLQAAKLECEFGEPMDAGGDSKENTLTCTDPTFSSENEDGSIAGATSQLVVKHTSVTGDGLDDLKLEGSHASVPDDARAVKTLTKHFRTLSDEPTVPAIADWIDGHIDDRLPHTAYVGNQLVHIGVTPDSMMGDSVTATAHPERPALGLPADDGGVDPSPDDN